MGLIDANGPKLGLNHIQDIDVDEVAALVNGSEGGTGIAHYAEACAAWLRFYILNIYLSPLFMSSKLYLFNVNFPFHIQQRCFTLACFQGEWTHADWAQAAI